MWLLTSSKILKFSQQVVNFHNLRGFRFEDHSHRFNQVSVALSGSFFSAPRSRCTRSKFHSIQMPRCGRRNLRPWLHAACTSQPCPEIHNLKQCLKIWHWNAAWSQVETSGRNLSWERQKASARWLCVCSVVCFSRRVSWIWKTWLFSAKVAKKGLGPYLNCQKCPRQSCVPGCFAPYPRVQFCHPGTSGSMYQKWRSNRESALFCTRKRNPCNHLTM